MTTKEDRIALRRTVETDCCPLEARDVAIKLLDELDSKDAHIAAMQARIDGLEARIDGKEGK